MVGDRSHQKQIIQTYHKRVRPAAWFEAAPSGSPTASSCPPGHAPWPFSLPPSQSRLLCLFLMPPRTSYDPFSFPLCTQEILLKPHCLSANSSASDALDFESLSGGSSRGGQLLIYPSPKPILREGRPLWQWNRRGSQISLTNPGSQWGERCRSQIALTSGTLDFEILSFGITSLTTQTNDPLYFFYKPLLSKFALL